MQGVHCEACLWPSAVDDCRSGCFDVARSDVIAIYLILLILSGEHASFFGVQGLRRLPPAGEFSSCPASDVGLMPRLTRHRSVAPKRDAPVIATRSTAQPDVVNMLEELPDIVYQIMINKYLCDLEVKALRLVSKRCRIFIDTNTTALTPRLISQLQVSLDKLTPTIRGCTRGMRLPGGISLGEILGSPMGTPFKCPQELQD